MKRKNQLDLMAAALLLLLSSFSFNGRDYYGGEVPLLMKRSAFEGAIKTMESRDLERTSRISFKDDYIYIVELYEGIHVINNVNPQAPKTEYFISIPGCVDMAIKNAELFARSAEDLVAIDISDISNVKEITRVKETFPELTNRNGNLPYRFSKKERPDDTVIVNWTEE